MTCRRALRALYLGASVTSAIAFTASTPSWAIDAASAQSSPEAVRAQVEAGKQLFVTTCGNCHGSDGKGALGPALADRNLTLDLVRTTVLNGRVGTPMPPFKDELDANSLAAVIAYAEWVTSGGRLPNAVIASESLAGSGAAGPAVVSSQPVAIGRASGVPARGAELFFDPTRLDSCRNCHTYANKGGPVGPDLATTGKTPQAVFDSITHAKVATPDFPAITVELRDGSRVVGIKAEETDDVIRLYDVSSLPPVNRSILKSSIDKVSALEGSGVYDHTALAYSKQDLLDLSAYLAKPRPPATNPQGSTP